MPLKRTPPASPIPVSTAAANRVQTVENTDRCTMQHCESAPDLPSLMLNITERKKRKHDGENSNITSCMSNLFASFSQEQEKRFHELKNTIISLKEQNEDLQRSVDMMSNKYDEFLTRITTLELESKQDKQIISFLEEKIERMEQKSRNAGIEIRNIPKTHEETKGNLSNIVKNIGKVLKMDLVDADIRDVYRIKSKDMSNPIILELSSVITKEKIINGVKSFNKSKSKDEKLNTAHLNYANPSKPIYISETLSQGTQKLFYLARKFSKTHNYKFCWTSRGAVYLRKSESSSQIKINSLSDIEKLHKIE